MREKNIHLQARKKYEKPELTKHSPLREVTAAARCVLPCTGPLRNTAATC